MATPARDKWILFGVLAATVGILVHLDWIVLVYVLYVIGGIVVLIFVPFDRKRARSRWAKNLLAVSALLLILKGGLQLLMYYRIWTPSHVLQRGLPYTLACINGVVLGFLLAVSFSGELRGRQRCQDASTA